jgi:hypothetical protein
MSTFEIAPGATVLRAPHHGGLDRILAGAGWWSAVWSRAAAVLADLRRARAAARDEARLAEMIAADPRVRADWQAARDRALG